MRVRLVLVLGLALLALSLPARSFAQSPIVVTSQTHQVNFPHSLRFSIQARSSAPIQTLILTVWQRGVALGSRHSPPFTQSTSIQAEYEWNFQWRGEGGGYLPPGTHGEYSWHIQDAAGNVYDTPHQQYYISDPTHKFQTLAQDGVQVSWYVGDQNFGKAILQRALQARAFMADQLKVSNDVPLEISIYADRQDFFNSLPSFSPEWTGGFTFPEYGVILINFDPDNLEWGLRATSHELSHAILHAKIRGIWGDYMPHWLDEGLAVYNETDDHIPDPQFQEAFDQAVRRDTLIPLERLEARFPGDGDQATLAYGESYEMVKFLIQEYGEARFARLLDAYAKGAQTSEGFQEVYEMNTSQLENVWRGKIGAPLRDVKVFAMPTVGALPTYEVSSALSSTPAPSTATTTEPTREPTRVAAVATPVAVEAAPVELPSVPTNGLCGGALALSGLIGYGLIRRRRG